VLRARGLQHQDHCVPSKPPWAPPLQGKYRLGRKIGSGSFGDIYIGELGQARAPSWASKPNAGLPRTCRADVPCFHTRQANMRLAVTRRHASADRGGGGHQVGECSSKACLYLPTPLRMLIALCIYILY
jgi:hypothetical protein